MLCIDWFCKTFSLFAKLGYFIDNENIFDCNVVQFRGAVVAELYTKSMPGHF